MTDLSLTEEDRVVIYGILMQARQEGTPNPVLPADVDIDGDGIVDGFGLDENDEVILVSGVTLSGTMYLAVGDEGVQSNE